MSFPHEVIAALPTAAPADKERLRDMCTRRFAYCLADDEAASDFVAKDPVSSIPPLNLIQGGTLFAYDETDTTTSASAVCLVTNDACRYKSGVVEPPYSVLTYSTTAQPADVDVSDGDTFLLPIGATGADWAGKAGQIAIRVGAKWHFAINPIGRKLYVEDENTFYYRNESGVWTAGNGANEFAANSIPITAIIGTKASFVVKIENQTTNAPPASPVAPVAYIIGPSPTGAWAGLAGQLAICLVDGVFTIIAPNAGDQVYDKALSKAITYTGSAWDAANNAFVLLSSQLASASATLDFAIPQTDIYDAFEIHISTLKPATDDAVLYLRVGTGAGPTYQTTGYRWSASLVDQAGQSLLGGLADGMIRLTGPGAGTGAGVGNAAGENLSGTIKFNNPEVSNLTGFLTDIEYSEAVSSQARYTGCGRYDSSAIVTGIRFLFSSGNIAAGRISLYGLRKT